MLFHKLKVWLCSGLLLSLPLYAQDIALPDMGASADNLISLAEEYELGQAFMRKLRRANMILDDPAIDLYLNAVGQKLGAHSSDPSREFTFFAINDPAINAFATLGGFIGVNTGLVMKTHHEGELASVVAHEVAHVTQRHIARTAEDMSKFSLPAIAGMLAAVVAGTQNPDIAQAAITSITAGAIQMQLSFTLAHEKEADRIGMQTLASAGYNPHHMTSFFEKMQAATRYGTSAAPEYLRTHPMTANRVAEARDRAEQFTPVLPQDTPMFHLIRARMLVLTRSNHKALFTQLTQALENGQYRDERAVRYALALTALELGNNATVDEQLRWFKQHDDDRVLYRLLAADNYLAQQKPEPAVRILDNALAVYPGDKVLGLRYAQALLVHGKPAKAKAVLIEIAPQTRPEYFRMLAEAQNRTGELAESHMSLAELYYLNGQTQLAIDQLKQAQQQDGIGYYQLSRVNARLRELEMEWREELKQMANNR